MFCFAMNKSKRALSQTLLVFQKVHSAFLGHSPGVGKHCGRDRIMAGQGAAFPHFSIRKLMVKCSENTQLRFPTHLKTGWSVDGDRKVIE